MKKFVFAVILILILILTCSGCGSDNKETQSAPPKSEGMEIKTDYLTLKYPKEWEEKLTVNSDADTTQFFCGDVHLFDINFSGSVGTLIGTAVQDSGNVVVYAKSYPVDEQEENRDELLKMQEDINYLIDSLSQDYHFYSGEVVSDEDTAAYEVNTAVGKLYYPKKWKSKVTFQDSENEVTLLAGDTQIFKLTLGGEKGTLLGQYNGKDLRLILFKVTDAENIAMQEDVNCIIQHLESSKDFVPAG